MPKLNDAEIDVLLAEQPAWTQVNGALTREWKFKDFVAAMIFVNRVGAIAEEADHHPDIDIRYNKVRLALLSHDVGGLTERDARMVTRLSKEF
jgi:4a-hydroxytetrahydrobiopterin dehydratase